MDIQFIASVFKVQTLADGGIRISLDTSEHALEAMAAFAHWQANGVAVVVMAKPAEEEEPKEQDYGL